MLNLVENSWSIQNTNNLSKLNDNEICQFFSSALQGKELIPQDQLKRKFVFVIDEKENLNDGGRYHKSNQGGDIHTDSPQYETQPKFIILYCISQAMQGGESIIVDGHKLYNHLTRIGFNEKDLEVQVPFEQRPEGKIIWGQIFYKKKDFVKVRYLRSYVDSALLKIKSKNKNLYSILHEINHFLDDENNHEVFKLNHGDILIIDNERFLHGRKSFHDSTQARKMLRIWIK
jgi:alpha-ketoglutarate-dependent taurine dioxygenase